MTHRICENAYRACMHDISVFEMNIDLDFKSRRSMSFPPNPTCLTKIFKCGLKWKSTAYDLWISLSQDRNNLCIGPSDIHREATYVVA